MIQFCRSRLVTMGILCVFGTLLTGCDRTYEPPAPHVARALDSLFQSYLSDNEYHQDFADLINDYKKSGNPNEGTADGTTLLHLACHAGNRMLVEHLLDRGADPNAESEEFLLPIVCLFDNPQNKTAETRFMMNLLLANGAKIEDYSVFQYAEHLHADMYLELLKQSWRGESGRQAGVVPAQNGWAEALRYVLDNAGTPLPDEYKMLLHEVALGDCYLTGTERQYLVCARMLLDKGCSVEQQNAHGTTPIMTAAKAAYDERERHTTPCDTLQLLLQKDADIYRTFENDPDYPGYSAYDLLMGNKALMNNLTAMGYRFDAPPPLDFSEGEALMRAVLRADMRQEPEESLRAAFGQIATLLSPDDSLKSHPDYPEALCSAINLLMRADEIQGTAAVTAMPLWLDEDFWTEESMAPMMVLRVLHQNRIVLPSVILLPLAQRLESKGERLMAAEITELLGYGGLPEPELEALTQDERPAIQAGAWQALLLRRGLPTAKSGSVEEWLWQHHASANNAEMKRALRLTSLHRLWQGEMTSAEQALLFADMEAIGAADAAEWYRQAVAVFDKEEELEKMLKTAALVSYPLESATARFLAEHAALFAVPDEVKKKEEKPTKNTD